MKIRQLSCMTLALFFIFASSTYLQAEEKPAAPAAPAADSVHAGHGAATPADVDHSRHDMGSQADKTSQTATLAQLDNLSAEMEAIKASTDPVERKKLMQAHLASMTKTLTMLKDAGSGSMMEPALCPMMQTMQHGQEQGDKMHPSGTMTMGQGGMNMEHMAKCHEMMQVKTKLTNSLLEQLIEMQGQLLSSGK